jgi:hypothetical protein
MVKVKIKCTKILNSLKAAFKDYLLPSLIQRQEKKVTLVEVYRFKIPKGKLLQLILI